MAEYFAASTGSVSNDGLSEATAGDLSTLFKALLPGDKLWVKSDGVYTIDVLTDSNSRLSGDNIGTLDDPIVVEGYHQVPGDLEDQNIYDENGVFINTENFPKIIFITSTNLAHTVIEAKAFWAIKFLDVESTERGKMTCVTDGTFYRVSIHFTGTCSYSQAIEVGSRGNALCCQGLFDMTSHPSTRGIGAIGSSSFHVCIVGCRVINLNETNLLVSGITENNGFGTFLNNLVVGAEEGYSYRRFDGVRSVFQNAAVSCDVGFAITGSGNNRVWTAGGNLAADCGVGFSFGEDGNVHPTLVLNFAIGCTAPIEYVGTVNRYTEYYNKIAGIFVYGDMNDFFRDYPDSLTLKYDSLYTRKINSMVPCTPLFPSPQKVAEAIWAREGRSLTG